MDRSLDTSGKVYVGRTGYWIRAATEGPEAAIGVGHRMCGDQILARLRVSAPQRAGAQADTSISGLLACAPLAGTTAAVAEELAAIQQALAWAWIER